MEVYQANSEDNEQLLEFLNSTSLPGYVELNTIRHSPYDAIYQIQSDDYDTFVVRDQSKRIFGTFSLLYREGYIDGSLQNFGYMTDLRIGSSREALVAWSRQFLEILESSQKKRNCRQMFTILSQDAGKAYNTFLRSRTRISTFPRYHLLRKFVLVTVNGRFPFVSNPLNSIRIESGSISQLAPLLNYLSRKAKNHPLNFSYNEEAFLKRIHSWPGLALEDFLIAYDSQNNIIGCIAPWNPRRLQSYQVTSYHGSIAAYRRIFGLGSLLGITKRLPRPNKELNFKFLTHLFVNNHDIFQALLFAALKRTNGHEFLVYQNFDGDLLTWLPRYFIGWSMPFGLYSIGPESPDNASLQPSPLLPPPFIEAALI